MREVWTIGHSTTDPPAFVARLASQRIGLLADVRAHPGSRSSPQFMRDAMAEWLPDAGIRYEHLAALGGRRRKQDIDPDVNRGWHNTSFKNYADYTLSAAYQDAIARLTSLALERRTVMMCAESLPWRCHRLLIANTLAAAGWRVRHIIGDAEPVDHELGRWGAVPEIVERRVTYPG